MTAYTLRFDLTKTQVLSIYLHDLKNTCKTSRE